MWKVNANFVNEFGSQTHSHPQTISKHNFFLVHFWYEKGLPILFGWKVAWKRKRSTFWVLIINPYS